MRDDGEGVEVDAEDADVDVERDADEDVEAGRDEEADVDVDVERDAEGDAEEDEGAEEDEDEDVEAAVVVGADADEPLLVVAGGWAGVVNVRAGPLQLPDELRGVEMRRSEKNVSVPRARERSITRGKPGRGRSGSRTSLPGGTARP